MKKAFAIVLALAFALSMAVLSFADGDLLKELVDAVGADTLEAAAAEVLNDAGLTVDTTAEDLDDESVEGILQGLLGKLDLSEDLEAKVKDMFSGDFVSLLAGVYCDEPVPETPDAPPPADPAPPVNTGSSPAIAIAAFAALSVAAAAAFVMKKKEA